MNAEAILLMNDRALFPKLKELDKRFRQLAREWHPDRNKDPIAGKVMAHISAMHSEAEKREAAPTNMFVREDGSKFQMEYLRQRACEGFDIFVGETSIAYVVGKTNEDLANRASARKWTFEANHRKDLEPLFPNPTREIRLHDGRMFVYRRNRDQVLLRDLMDADGKIPGPSVAWMISRMLNLACFLDYKQVSHLALSPDVLFVSPENHTMALVGPTIFATDYGKKPLAAPKRTLEVVPAIRGEKFAAGPQADLKLIRDIGLHLLGDPSGNRLRTFDDVRPEIATWLTNPPAPTALEDFQSWEQTLGPRKFVKYPKSASDYYAA